MMNISRIVVAALILIFSYSHVNMSQAKETKKPGVKKSKVKKSKAKKSKAKKSKTKKYKSKKSKTENPKAARPNPHKPTREMVFNRYDKDNSRFLTRKEFVRAGVGNGNLRRILSKEFDRIDRNGNDKLSWPEIRDIVKRRPKDKKAKSAEFKNDGDLIYPERGQIIDVDEYFEMVEIVILPFEDPDKEYDYRAKTIVHDGTPTANPPTDAEPLYDWWGIYLSGWITETHSSDNIDDFVTTKTANRRIVVWERHRVWDPMTGLPGPWQPWIHESRKFYAHKSGYYDLP